MVECLHVGVESLLLRRVEALVYVCAALLSEFLETHRHLLISKPTLLRMLQLFDVHFEICRPLA